MTAVKIQSIEKYTYTGKVYNIEVEPNHPVKDDQYYVHADNGLVVHNCHPRDNIALRWLAEKLDLGYDIFDTIMHAREQQARNLAVFVAEQSIKHNLPIVIHGKAYKPDVDILDGSYSLLVGSYLHELGANFSYADPGTNDLVPDNANAVILLAHNRQVTYGYSGSVAEQNLYFVPGDQSVIIDPWRTFSNDRYQVIHYGNTRDS